MGNKNPKPKTQKRKILLYGDYYHDASGFAKIFLDLIPELLKAGWDVRQVGLRYTGINRPKKELIRVYPTQIKGVQDYWSAEILEMAIQDFEPDIVLTQQDYFMLPHITPVLSKPFRKEFKWIHYGVMDGAPFAKEMIPATSWAHYHIYAADFTKNTVEKAIPGIRGETIYPAVDTDIFKPIDKKAIRKKFNLDKTFNVIFVGRNQYRKNIPALFEAVKKLIPIIPNIRLVYHSIPTITPQGTPNSHELTAISKELGIEEYISHVQGDTSNILPYKIINELYNAGDILVLPTMGEGFGLPLTEAMAAGLPTIGTDCSAVTEVIGDRGLLAKVAGWTYVDTGCKHAIVDVNDLAQCIYRMSGDENLRKESVKKGLEFTKTLTPEKVAERFIKVFEKVLKEDYQPLAVEKML